MNKKLLFIDIYQPVLGEDNVAYVDVIHLEELNIVTAENINSLVNKLKELLGGDGFYFRIEEFETRCYINIFTFFEQDTSILLDYFASINTENDLAEYESINFNESNEEVLLSVDGLFDQRDLDELLSYFEKEDIGVKVSLRERSAFERGAGDYHENIVIAFVTGLGQAVGEKILSVISKRYNELHSPRINKVKSKDIIQYISEETGINIHDLNVASTKKLQEDNNITHIELTSRYKNISVFYNETTNNINYEVFSKSQTMI